MHTFSDLRQAALPGPTYVMLGNFDGLHLGHQALLIRARELAAANPSHSAQTAIVTFNPHPFAVLRPGQPLLTLTTPSERLMLAAALGVEVGVVHPFTLETTQLSARDFVMLLQTHLGMAGLVVGPGFALGRNRSGDIPTLRALGTELGFIVEVVEPITHAGIPARSSTIRDLLVEGDVAAAAALLGRPYGVTGDVARGDQRGRLLGSPTANITVPAGKLLPANGVYATLTRLCTPSRAWAFLSVTNVGIRPTVDGQHHRVEAHLLDFPPPELPDNLYGQILVVEFIARLRGEKRFDSLDALSAQIQQDIAQARRVLAAHP
jgi:riboflavin kinase/FMN adenylyltransferase